MNPINAILDLKLNNGEGFAVVNLQCSLIETIESFINGWKYEHPHFIKMDGNSFRGNKNVFMSFFKNHNAFKLMESKSCDFYINVRCACLHETQTKNGWTIHSDTEQTNLVFNGEKIIFRENFQKALENSISDYKKAIIEGVSFNNIDSSTELRDNFKAKMNNICDKS